jgi:predicted amidophosphoribosyltransferase
MTKKSPSGGSGGGFPWWVHALWIGASLIAPIRKCPGCANKAQLWRRNCPRCGRKLW